MSKKAWIIEDDQVKEFRFDPQDVHFGGFQQGEDLFFTEVGAYNQLCKFAQKRSRHYLQVSELALRWLEART
jgi:hypothetical protein